MGRERQCGPAFDADSPTPAVAAKAIFPIEAYAADGAGDFRVRLGDAELGHGHCRGRVNAGHTIERHLTFTPSAREARRAPWLLHYDTSGCTP